uniref:Uncharacterized protein n=1 Tax=Anopheles atroparvus TaxID=41427 RepID=A0AAG5D278_ANOAO
SFKSQRLCKESSAPFGKHLTTTVDRVKVSSGIDQTCQTPVRCISAVHSAYQVTNDARPNHDSIAFSPPANLISKEETPLTRRSIVKSHR